MHVTKETLGVGYLVGTGVALSAVLLVRLAVGRPDAVDLIGTTTGLFLSVALAYAGYWFAGSELDGDHVWTVSKWGGFGVGLVTLASLLVGLMGVVDPSMHFRSNLVVSNVAAGGVVGVLVGGIRELKTEHEQSLALNQRNVVLNRVLRHNIRNDVNTILGYADQLEEELESGRASTNGEIEVIKGRARSVAALSEKARRIEEDFTREWGTPKPVDVVALTERGLDNIRKRYPEPDIELTGPDQLWARASNGVEVIVENLVENAVVHGAEGSAVEVSVGTEGGWAEIRIADNGEGIPQEEIAVLVAGKETPLNHGNGLGLWLVKWLVDSYGGKLSFGENEPTGSIVRVRLPKATRPAIRQR